MIWRSIFDFSLLTGRIFFSNPCIFTARLLLAQGKEFGDEAEIHQIAFVYTAETMGSQAFLVLP